MSERSRGDGAHTFGIPFGISSVYGVFPIRRLYSFRHSPDRRHSAVWAAAFDPMCPIAPNTATMVTSLIVTLPRDGSVTAVSDWTRQFLAACPLRCILPLLTWRSVVPGNAWTRFVPSSETLVARQGAQPTVALSPAPSSTAIFRNLPDNFAMYCVNKYAELSGTHGRFIGPLCASTLVSFPLRESLP